MEKIKIPQATKEGFIECEVGGVYDGSYPDSATRRGRVQGGGTISPTVTCNCEGLRRIEPQILRKYRTEEQKEIRRKMGDKGVPFANASKAPATDGCSNTLTSVQKDNLLAEPGENVRYRIRKLTPRECFRLMGVDDEDIDTIQAAGISNSQMYKLAGNSIVKDVLYHIFRKAYVEPNPESGVQTLF